MRKLLVRLICLIGLVSCKDAAPTITQSTLEQKDSLIEARLRLQSTTLQYSLPDSAVEINHQRKKIFERYKNNLGIISCYNTLTYIYSSILQDKQKAKRVTDSAWALVEKSENEHLRYRALYGYGVYYLYIQEDLDSATHYFLSALKLQPEKRDTTFYENTHTFLSDIYASQGNFASALNYYQPLIQKAELDQQAPLSILLFLSAYAFAIENKGKDSLAFSYLHKAKTIGQALNSTTFNSAIFTYYAEYYQKKNNIDSSNHYAQLAIENIRKKPQPIDKIEKPYIVLLHNYCQLAEFETASSILKQAQASLDTSKIIKDELLRFYELEYEIYKNTHEDQKAYLSLQKLNTLQSMNFDFSKKDQLLRHEKELKKLSAEKIILKKNIEIKRQKVYNYLLIGTVALLSIMVIFTYLDIQRRRKFNQIKSLQLQQEKELQQKKELLKVQIDERNRIAQDMHDDLGSTLTSTLMAVELIKMKPGAAEPLEMIENAANTLSDQINEVIWNLNVKNDRMSSLSNFIISFAKKFLTQANITLNYKEHIEANYVLEGEKRRQIYLIAKELLNNIVKHSKATLVNLNIQAEQDKISIQLSDNGLGFNLEELPKKDRQGYGIGNLQHKVNEMGGKISWTSHQGTLVYLELPITKA